MNIDISGIIEAKLAQMEADGVIRKKIEDVLEKSILSAITSELESYGFTRELKDQVREALGGVAEQSGLAAYNGFISQKVRQIVQEICTDDLTAKLQKALEGVLLAKHEGVKLSDIFKRHQEYVNEHVDESDKYAWERYTAELEWHESGSFIHWNVKLAERPDATKSYSYDSDKMPDIELEFCTYREERAARIARLHLGGRDITETLRIGTLNEVEAFVVNLYYNETKVQMDMEDADDYGYFDIDI